jgi:hypothetical protein
MRKNLIALMIVFAAAGLSAMPMAGKRNGIDPQKILDAAPGAADKTEGELTLGERLAIASAISVSNQERSYVRRSAGASFLLPGAGQMMTGDYGLGALHMGAEAAIIGGSLAALYFLAPAELLDFSGTREQRRAAVDAYMTPGRIGEILPAIGVIAGATALSLANRAIAAHGARNRAEANLASGKVEFQPSVVMSDGMPGLGLGMALRLR